MHYCLVAESKRLKAERSKLQDDRKLSVELTRMSKAEVAKLQAAREENQKAARRAEVMALKAEEDAEAAAAAAAAEAEAAEAALRAEEEEAARVEEAAATATIQDMHTSQAIRVSVGKQWACGQFRDGGTAKADLVHLSNLCGSYDKAVNELVEQSGVGREQVEMKKEWETDIPLRSPLGGVSPLKM